MIFHSSIVALSIGSLLTSGMLVYSCWYGLTILRRWDIGSGSELQLGLERKTYLISTMMTYALGFQILSLFLFIYTVDALHTLFVGAMCAAGTLKVNAWGYPTILLKIVNFLLAGVWLIVNFTDNRAYDYPLIRRKYLLLLLITPLLVAETVMQGAYFLGLKPEVITSCCGTLFTSGGEGLIGGLAGLPQGPTELAFYGSMAATFGLGILFYFKGKAAYLFSISSLFTFITSVAALISFISIYFYELPTHHCPFCILQQEYYYVGYGIDAMFLGGAVTGLGVGVLMPFRGIESLKTVLPRIQQQLSAASLLCYLVFLIIVGYGMITSNLRMTGL